LRSFGQDGWRLLILRNGLWRKKKKKKKKDKATAPADRCTDVGGRTKSHKLGGKGFQLDV
jgi:hypothetical protein